MTVRFIGIGSPFGADRIGWLVIDALEDVLGGREGVELVRFDRPGAALVEAMAGAETVVLIDALDDGNEPGEVRELHLHELRHDVGPSTHGFGVADALSLAESLGELPSALRIFGVAVRIDDPGDVEGLARLAASRIARYMSDLFSP